MQIDSYSKWELLRKMIVLRISKEISLTDLARLLHKSSTNPYFRLAVKFLINNNALTYTKKQYSAQLIKLDNKKLLKLVWDTIYVDNAMELIKIKYPLGFVT